MWFMLRSKYDKNMYNILLNRELNRKRVSHFKILKLVAVQKKGPTGLWITSQFALHADNRIKIKQD